jgi:hypothetical protein
MIDCAGMRRVERSRYAVAAIAVMAMLLAAACSSNLPLQVTTIQLGRSINPDKTVASHTTRFKPTDTIYATVLTDGSGSGKIKVRWLYRGTPLSEREQESRIKDRRSTEFHLQNSSGFPPGDYTVNFSSTAGRLAPGRSGSTRTNRRASQASFARIDSIVLPTRQSRHLDMESARGQLHGTDCSRVLRYAPELDFLGRVRLLLGD